MNASTFRMNDGMNFDQGKPLTPGEIAYLLLKAPVTTQRILNAFATDKPKLKILVNKYYQSKQELINYRIEKNSTIQEYIDKISKAEGDQFSSISSVASGQADVAKLENMYASYDIRNQLYYITAPQSGQITKAKKAGIGEFMKEGEMIYTVHNLYLY